MSELKAVHAFVVYEAYTKTGDDEAAQVYIKSEADKAIAELKDKCQMHDFFWDGCGFAKRGFKNAIAVSEAFDNLEAENRRLKRALWLTRADRNKSLRTLGNFCAYIESRPATKQSFYQYPTRCFLTWCKYLKLAEDKCRAKAEEYRERHEWDASKW